MKTVKRSLRIWMAGFVAVAVGSVAFVSAQNTSTNTSTSSDIHESCENLSLSTDYKHLKGDCNRWATDDKADRTYLDTEVGVSLDINKRLAFDEGNENSPGALVVNTVDNGDYTEVCTDVKLQARPATNPGIDLIATCKKFNCPNPGGGVQPCNKEPTLDLSAAVENANGSLGWK